MGALAADDPDAAIRFVQEFRREMGIQDQQPQYDQPQDRPVYPGATGYDQGGYYYDPAAALQNAIDFGNPVDRWGDVQAVWANVDPGYLAEQVLATFPAID